MCKLFYAKNIDSEKAMGKKIPFDSTLPPNSFPRVHVFCIGVCVEYLIAQFVCLTHIFSYILSDSRFYVLF